MDSDFTLSNVYGPPTCGTVFRKDYMVESGGFSDAYYPSFDWYFLYRYCKKYRLYRSFEVLGYYRFFENTSSLETTKAAFLRDRLMYADYVANNSRLGKVMKYLFSNEQNNRILDSEFSNYAGKVASDYFEEYEIKERRIRKYIYKELIKQYWLMKERFYLLFG